MLSKIWRCVQHAEKTRAPADKGVFPIFHENFPSSQIGGKFFAVIFDPCYSFFRCLYFSYLERMHQGETGTEGAQREFPYFDRQVLLQHMAVMLAEQGYEFSYREKDQTSIIAVSDRKERDALRAKRDEAVTLAVDILDFLVVHKFIDSDFFKGGIAEKAEFAAEVIQAMATGQRETVLDKAI